MHRNHSVVAVAQNSVCTVHRVRNLAGDGAILAPSPHDRVEPHQHYRNWITVVAFGRDVLLAFARVHILYHASEEPIFGTGMMAELRRHGYALGPGTIYPLLHRLEADGLLVCRAKVVGGKTRKYYAITRRGQAELDVIAPTLAELAGEVLPQSPIPRKRERATRGPPR